VGWGRPPSSRCRGARSAPVPPLASAPSPHAGASLAALLSPPARPGTPYRTPRPTPARRSIHKKHTQVGATSPAEPGRASAYLGPRPRVGRGRAWGRGGEGRGSSRPSPPGASRRSSQRSGSPPSPGLGVSRPHARTPARPHARPHAGSADAEGRWPSRAEGTRGRSLSPSPRRPSEVKVSGATTGRSQR
jgi:hypothetical protein